MLGNKDKNIIKQIIREMMVEQLNKSSFKSGYKPVDTTPTNNDEGVNNNG